MLSLLESLSPRARVYVKVSRSRPVESVEGVTVTLEYYGTCTQRRCRVLVQLFHARSGKTSPESQLLLNYVHYIVEMVHPHTATSLMFGHVFPGRTRAQRLTSSCHLSAGLLLDARGHLNLDTRISFGGDTFVRETRNVHAPTLVPVLC